MNSSDSRRGLADNPETVRLLQNVLWTLGFPAGTIDGIYGPKTTEAVRRFQRRYGLDPTGEFDVATRDLLSSKFANEMSSTVQDTPNGGVASVSDVRRRVFARHGEVD